MNQPFERKYVDRLLNEWKQHGKIIIATDFDDTISTWRLQDSETCNIVIEILKQAKYTGAYIVVFTACKEDRYDEIKNYCKSKGLEIDAINKNPIELPYGNHSKIYANIFLDDRAGLNESLLVLQTALFEYRGYLQNQIKLDDIG
jgi:hypothetical protein